MDSTQTRQDDPQSTHAVPAAPTGPELAERVSGLNRAARRRWASGMRRAGFTVLLPPGAQRPAVVARPTLADSFHAVMDSPPLHVQLFPAVPVDG